MNKPFANRSRSEERAKAEKAAAEFEERRRSISSLVKNEDFRQWFQYVNLELCGTDFGLNELDPFTQGKRATMTWLKQTLCIGDGAPEFLALIARAHYRAIGEAHAKSTLDEQNKETR